MIRKNKPSLSYLNSSVNRSPSKETHSFAKAERFIEKKRFSPDKYYDVPDSLGKRCAGIGIGNKTDIVLKQLSNPTMYHLRSQFGEYDDEKVMMSKVDRKTMKRNHSYMEFRQKTDTTLHNKESCERRVSKNYRNESPQKDQSRQRTKSYKLNENGRKDKERKSANQARYQCTQKCIDCKSKTSYTDLLIQPSRERSARMKTQGNVGNSPQMYHVDADKFKDASKPQNKQERMLKGMQREDPRVRLGPGSYNICSQFGEKIRY